MLHNVMPIFTFMGASVVRKDDSYSFEVITKTLDTVIPALIQVCDYCSFLVLTFIRPWWITPSSISLIFHMI